LSSRRRLFAVMPASSGPSNSSPTTCSRDEARAQPPGSTSLQQISRRRCIVYWPHSATFNRISRRWKHGVDNAGLRRLRCTSRPHRPAGWGQEFAGRRRGERRGDNAPAPRRRCAVQASDLAIGREVIFCRPLF
jgi:hypothetical protein